MLGGMGLGDGGLVPNTDTYLAPIRDDGTLGAWARGPDLPEPVGRHGVFASGRDIWTIGGFRDGTGTVTRAVRRYTVDAQGTLAPAASDIDVPTDGVLVDAKPFAIGATVYSVAADGLGVMYATRTSAGLGAWASQPTNLGALGVGAVGDLGLTTASADTVFYFGRDQKGAVVQVRAEGAITDPWSPISYPASFAGGNSGGAAVFDDRVYVLGASVPTVWSARIDDLRADAAAPWRVEAQPYPDARASFTTVQHERFLYVVSGRYGVATVSFTVVRSDGTLDVWRNTTPLPDARDGVSFAAIVR